jgi:hypothetical protein
VGVKEIGFEDGRWMEQAQDRVQWLTLVLAVLTPLFRLGSDGGKGRYPESLVTRFQQYALTVS